jgi:predicted transcriptional regulator
MGVRRKVAWQRQADRVRKLVTVTLSDAARETLDELAERSGESRSALIERLIMEAASKRTNRPRTEVRATTTGQVLPTEQAIGRVRRMYPELRDTERFKVAQAITIAELIIGVPADAPARKRRK